MSQEPFQLVSCPGCGAVFTTPRPDQNSIGAYYKSEDYISHTNSSRSFQDKLYQLVRKRALRTKHKLISSYRPNGRLLDVGCGTGHFLGYMKSKGYLATGMEPDPHARQQAVADHSLDVLPSLDLVPSNEQFQVVTMWHVLEHVPDIRRTFKKLYSLMSDGGYLFIAVPDHESWDAHHYGSDWAAYDVPRHLNHFRRKDLDRLFREHGFEQLATKPMWFDAFYIAMLSERYKGRGPMLALFKGLCFGLWSNLHAAFSDRPTSSTLYVAQKREP